MPKNLKPETDSPVGEQPAPPALVLTPAQQRLLLAEPRILELLTEILRVDGNLKNGAIVEIPRRTMLATRNLRSYLLGLSPTL